MQLQKSSQTFLHNYGCPWSNVAIEGKTQFAKPKIDREHIPSKILELGGTIPIQLGWFKTTWIHVPNKYLLINWCSLSILSWHVPFALYLTLCSFFDSRLACAQLYCRVFHILRKYILCALPLLDLATMHMVSTYEVGRLWLPVLGKCSPFLSVTYGLLVNERGWQGRSIDTVVRHWKKALIVYHPANGTTMELYTFPQVLPKVSESGAHWHWCTRPVHSSDRDKMF